MKKVRFLAVMPLALALATQGFCAEIAGKVADTRGQSVPAAMISLLNPAGKTLATANTDEKGKYLIKQVVPGDYHLSLKPPAGHLVGQTVAVSVNSKGEPRVAPRSAAFLDGTHYDPGVHDRTVLAASDAACWTRVRDAITTVVPGTTTA